MKTVTLTKEEILSKPNNYDLGDYVRAKLYEKSEQSTTKDRCVICGKESPYLVTTHIDLRIGYVEGAGQGCFQPKVC